jgi:sec-independent protein translocase protein TatC
MAEADPDGRMTVVDHLEELRRGLIVSLGAWGVATVIAFIFHERVLALLVHPLTVTLGHNASLPQTPIFLSPTEGFSIPLKVSAFAGFILALPVILWQAWKFVAPGLRPVERRFAGPFIFTALLLFGVGALFAYFVMPIGLGWLTTFLGGSATYLPEINEYFSFLMLLIVVFGVTFELPIVIVLLGLLGVVSSRGLRQRRRGIHFTIVVVAFIVTPGADLFTPMALALPLMALFELSCVVLDRAFRR